MPKVLRPITVEIGNLCRNYHSRDMCSDDFAKEIKSILDRYTELQDIAVVLDVFVGYRKIETICFNLFKNYFFHHIESDIDIQDFYRKYSIRFANL